MSTSKSLLIKERASQLGFDGCGITRLDAMPEDMARLKHWLDNGYNATMGYMANNLDKRENPALLVDGSRSAIVCLANYKPEKFSPYFAAYALSADYHYTLKAQLNKLLDYIKKLYPTAEGRAFVDSAPIFERSLAVRAGLGWIGRNSMVINREIGSFTFIATLITNLELEYDKPYIEDYCRGCTLCIKSCPTGAILDNRTIDARKCISYQTIENRGEIPEDIELLRDGMIFGCDRCQSVCPHNAKTAPTTNPIFSAIEGITDISPNDWQQMSSSEFKRRFGASALSRCGIKKLKQTIKY